MEEQGYIEFCPIECPKCGMVVLFLNEDGEHEFKCDCGFEDTLKIETIK